MEIYRFPITIRFMEERDVHRKMFPASTPFILIAEATGRHVNARFVRMVLVAKGADTITVQELFEERTKLFIFTRELS